MKGIRLFANEISLTNDVVRFSSELTASFRDRQIDAVVYESKPGGGTFVFKATGSVKRNGFRIDEKGFGHNGAYPVVQQKSIVLAIFKDLNLEIPLNAPLRLPIRTICSADTIVVEIGIKRELDIFKETEKQSKPAIKPAKSEREIVGYELFMITSDEQRIRVSDFMLHRVLKIINGKL